MWVQGILMANLAEKIKVYLEQNGKDWKDHLYFGGDIVIQNTSDGTGDKLTQWNVSGLAEPTTEQLDALDSEAVKLRNNSVAIANRLNEYPSLGDIVDAIFKKEAGDSTEFDALAAKREVTKTKFAKE